MHHDKELNVRKKDEYESLPCRLVEIQKMLFGFIED